MLLRRLDDYQSWMVEVGDKRLAIDPWLRADLVLPPGPWMFHRRRSLPPGGPDAIRDADALLLSAPFGDHCDPQTLEVLPRETPVFCNRASARRARSMGFSNITEMKDGDRIEPFAGLVVEGVAPAFPYRSDSLGFVFEGSGKRVYLETHLVDLGHKERLRRLDAMVIPVQSARLLGVMLSMSPERALEVVRELGPARVIPTGTDPQAAGGFMSRALIGYRGTVDEFGRLLGAANSGSTLLKMEPGQSLSLS